MNNGIFKTYALAVCFISLMCGSISTGIMLFNIVKIVAPELTLDSRQYELYDQAVAINPRPMSFRPQRSEIASISSNGEPVFIGESRALTSTPPLSEKEIQKKKDERRLHYIERHKFGAKQSIIYQVIIIFVSSVLFGTHWRLSKKTPNNKT